MLLVDRTFGASYCFGFNTQEQDNEVYGEGNLNTALFWEYDTRLGRRWNIDPVVKSHESSYASFANNPIWYIDIAGADSSLAPNSNTWTWQTEANDTYSSISERTGVSITDLQSWNTYKAKEIPIGVNLNLSDPNLSVKSPAIINFEGNGVLTIEDFGYIVITENPYVSSGLTILFTPSSGEQLDKNDSEYRIVQTFKTNHDIYESSGAYVFDTPPCVDVEFIDFSDRDGSKSLNMSYSAAGMRFEDHFPRMSKSGVDCDLYTNVETSLIKVNSAGQIEKRLATLTWGYVINSSGDIKTLYLIVTDTPSVYHRTALNENPSGQSKKIVE